METIETTEARLEDANKPEEKKEEQKKVEYKPLADVKSAEEDTAEKYEGGIIDSAKSENSPGQSLLSSKREVTITDEDKSNFIQAVVTGTRYKGTAYLYGGRIRVKFRSRSVEETDAILSFIHRNGILGKFVTQADIKDATLAALLVAQVEELSDVAYPEMKAPLKYVETPTGVEDPAWIKDMDMWKKKPEHLVMAIGDALVDFESKYWKMIQESRNENFWGPGESTGQ